MAGEAQAAEPPGRRTAGGGGGDGGSGRAAFPLLLPSSYPPSPGEPVTVPAGGPAVFFSRGVGPARLRSPPSTSRVLRGAVIGGRGSCGGGERAHAQAGTLSQPLPKPVPPVWVGVCLPSTELAAVPLTHRQSRIVFRLSYLGPGPVWESGCSLRLSFSLLPVDEDFSWLGPQASFVGCAEFERLAFFYCCPANLY